MSSRNVPFCIPFSSPLPRTPVPAHPHTLAPHSLSQVSPVSRAGSCSTGCVCKPPSHNQQCSHHAGELQPRCSQVGTCIIKCCSPNPQLHRQTPSTHSSITRLQPATRTAACTCNLGAQQLKPLVQSAHTPCRCGTMRLRCVVTGLTGKSRTTSTPNTICCC